MCLSLLRSASVSTIPVTSTRVLKNVHTMLFCEYRAICGSLAPHACFVANAMNSPQISPQTSVPSAENVTTVLMSDVRHKNMVAAENVI